MQTLKHLFAQHLSWTSLGVHSIFTISDDSGGASHDGSPGSVPKAPQSDCLGVHSILTLSDDSGGASHDGVFKVSVPMHTTPQRDSLGSTPPVMMGVLKISVSTQHLDGISLEFCSIFTLSDDRGGVSHG